ncbi:MAG: ABC transporter ATP-binding protein [Planctomycetota bacterium]
MQEAATADPATDPTTLPLRVANVSKSFRQGGQNVVALDDVSLDVSAGTFLAIMGQSGSGKSTLLHLMAGLARPTGGQVFVRGDDIARLSDRKLTLFRRRHIGLVFQSFNLIPTLTARENVALPLRLDGRDEALGRVDELLDTLGIAERRTHRPDAMSGGEQQRVAIGRALVTDPTVVLADEPTGNLDSANSRSVCELLRDLSTLHGKTIVMVTHEPHVAAYAHEVAVLRDGKLVERFTNGEFTDDAGVEVSARYQEALA